jgi:hypothetical protein
MVAPSQPSDPTATGREAAQAEYETSTNRYNEIYKAVWQNFSYMAVLAGAVLTFGERAFGSTQAALLACVPLLIWYWATFEPLDRYGVLVEFRILELEVVLGRRLYTMLFEQRFQRPAPGKISEAEDLCNLRRPWVGGAFLACLLIGLMGWCRPKWLPGVALVAGLVTFAYLVFERLRGRLHVRGTMRLCAVLLHAVFAFSIGGWMSGPTAASSDTTKLSLHGSGFDLEVATSAEALVLDLLREVSSSPSRQLPRDGLPIVSPAPSSVPAIASPSPVIQRAAP